MPDITATFTLTGEDYEYYLRYYYAYTKRGRRQMRRLYAVGVVIFLFFVVLKYDHPRFGIAHPGYFATYLAISAVLLGGGYWYLITRLWPAFAQTAVRRTAQKGMFSESSLTIGENDLIVRTAEGEGRLSWDSVSEVADTDDALYLFMGGINAFIIPKRAFLNAEDAEEALRRITAAMSTSDT
ncbi:MAG: YcxB family protein [Candidatus Hydrogenedentes bacterium]|nr:YcxB family protein [Candidatus Hydrogenedentota bacterium]